MKNEENILREKLATSHHIIHHYDWDDLLATHLSVRIPNAEALLVTPVNVPFEEISAENLVKSDLSGNILSSNGHAAMAQAINIHAEVYKANTNIKSAMHTHSTYGVAVSSLVCGLLYFNQQVLRFYQDVAYHDYDGLALNDEGKQIAKSLKDKKVMILRNHGLITTGTSIEEAIYRLYYLEKACELQVKALSAGEELIEINHEICQKTKVQFDKILSPKIEFEALKRRVLRSESI